MTKPQAQQPRITSGYGRSKPMVIPITAEESAKPACERCRHLTVELERCRCARGHALEARACADFSDCSRQRDYFPHFYHQDVRR